MTSFPLQFAGLLAFTDARLERMPDALRCNESRGQLSCFDGTCYDVTEMCDGVRQCVDGADELGCNKATSIEHSKKSVFTVNFLS